MLFFTGGTSSPEDPLILLRVWEGGMASHGGFIGVCIAIFVVRPTFQAIPFPHRRLDRQRRATRTLFRKNRQFHQWRTVGADHGGFLGDFVPQGSRVSRRRCKASLATLRRDTRRVMYLCFRSMAFLEIRALTRRAPGRLTGEFLIAYAIARIANEFFRQPDASLVMGMSRGQFYSLFLISGGFILVRIAKKG